MPTIVFGLAKRTCQKVNRGRSNSYYHGLSEVEGINHRGPREENSNQKSSSFGFYPFWFSSVPSVVNDHMNKIGFISLGCPKNLVDSEVMMGQLRQSGYQITPNADEADTVVVNTCGFIDSAKKESIEAILEAAQLNTNGKAKRLVVAGFLVERYR